MHYVHKTKLMKPETETLYLQDLDETEAFKTETTHACARKGDVCVCVGKTDDVSYRVATLWWTI